MRHPHRRSSSQKAVHVSPFLLLKPPLPDAIMEPRYLKSCIWLIVVPFTSGGGCEQQMFTIYSVLEAFSLILTSPNRRGWTIPSNNSCNEVPLDFRPRWGWNRQISHGNRTSEWSPIRSYSYDSVLLVWFEITRVINKIGSPRSESRFANQEYDYRLNWTTRSVLTNLSQILQFPRILQRTKTGEEFGNLILFKIWVFET